MNNKLKTIKKYINNYEKNNLKNKKRNNLNSVNNHGDFDVNFSWCRNICNNRARRIF